jgi:competence protein ComEA
LGVAVALLAVNSFGYLRYGSRPTGLERGAALSYRVDLNHARRAELLQLPGVGDSMARRIEDYRQASGGFRAVEDLANIRGIGPATMERLRPWVFVDREGADQDAEPQAQEVQPLPVASKRAAAPKNTATPPGGKSMKELALQGQRIDVNRASREELQRLPGVGPKLSQRIVEAREKGRFRTIDELRRVPGIGAKTLEDYPHYPHNTPGPAAA